MALHNSEFGTLALAQEALGDELITKDVFEDVLDQLRSLHPLVPNCMRHRYLLTIISSALQELKKSGRSLESFKKYEVPFAAHPTVHSNFRFSSENISTLIELLVSYASKWRLLGTALKFLPQELDNIEACVTLFQNSPKSYLIRLIEDWISNNLQHMLPPTRQSLEDALKSKTVGLGNVADELVKMNVNNPDLLCNDSYAFVNDLVGDLSLKVVVPENVSTLLEVQSSCCKKNGSWYQDGKECEQFKARRSGTQNTTTHYSRSQDGDKLFCCGNFLCLYKAGIDFDGKEVVYKERDSSSVCLSVTLQVSCVLDKFRGSLAAMYLVRPEVPEDSWPPVRCKKYINLALINQHEGIHLVSECMRHTIRGDVDDVMRDKTSIAYEAIYKSLEVGKLLLIEGRPGCGKSTFVHKFTRDWASNSKSGGVARLMLLVSLRVMNTFPNPDLSDILNLFKDLKVSKQLIEERDGKGVCFLFDGLDEYAPPNDEDSIVYKIINKTYLCESTVIVASRPAALTELRSRASKVIEVLGFQNSQILEYFDSYFSLDSAKAVELKRYLLSHQNIFHMCYLPLHAAMVALLYEVKKKIPETETEIYSNFTLSTLKRSCTKDETVEADDVIDFDSLDTETKYYFIQICKLALEKTISRKQVLNQDEVRSFFRVSKERDISLGLITIDKVADLYGFKNMYTFVHLTFQEYLAAYYISSQGYYSIISEYGEEDHMLQVWKFFCGLQGNIYEILARCTRGNTLFHVQCVHESQQPTNCTKLVEAVNNDIRLEEKILSVPDFTAIGYIANMSKLSFRLSLLNCSVNKEGVDALISKLSGASLVSLHIEPATLDKEYVWNLCDKYSIMCVSQRVKYGTYHVSGINSVHRNNFEDGINLMSRIGINSVHRNNFEDGINLMSRIGINSLHRNNFEDRIRIVLNCVAYIRCANTHCKSIVEVHYDGAESPSWSVEINKEPSYHAVQAILFAIMLIVELRFPSSSNLSCHFLSDVVSGEMCRVISYAKVYAEVQLFSSSEVLSPLPWFDIIWIKYQIVRKCIGYELEFLFLNPVRWVIIELDLSNGVLDFSDGALDLSDSALDFSDNRASEFINGKVDFSDGAASKLFCGLRLLTSLTKLRLNSNGMSDKGVRFFSLQLLHLHQLKELSLQCNFIHNMGGMALATALYHCTRLKKLDLAGNSFDDATALEIVKSLRNCEECVTLTISNRISLENSNVKIKL